VSGWLFQRGADIFYWAAPKRRQVALDNLALVYGDTLSLSEKKKIVRKSFQSGSLSVLELFLIKKIKKNAAARFTILGEEHYRQALLRQKGLLFVASHLGSWEYIAFAGYIHKVPRAVIVKRVRNPYLDRYIDKLRREIGSIPIPKVNAIRQTLSELHKNNGVAVIIDQWAGPEGLWAPFFGEPTSTTSLPARLAKKTGAALLPIFCIRKTIGHYEIQVLPEVLISEGEDWEAKTTRALNTILESKIREYPEQWSWGHRRWKPKPSISRR
jgi:KDO2-lipid IV(A) lauroyltransferase